jgi:stress-induced morphogen
MFLNDWSLNYPNNIIIHFINKIVSRGSRGTAKIWKITTKTGHYDIAEILLKMALKHQKSINQFGSSFRIVIATCKVAGKSSVKRDGHMI